MSSSPTTIRRWGIHAPGAPLFRPRPEPLTPGDLTVVPANQASWQDLQAVFGTRGYAAHCQCQRFKIGPHGWTAPTVAERMQRLEQESHCGYLSARRATGLLAYLDGEPVGWCAVEPRTAYPRLLPARVARKARGEDKDDVSVWAVTCFAARAGFRHRGITRVLAPRGLLCEAAHAAVRSPGPLAGFHARVRARRGGGVAIVATARKLAALVWTEPQEPSCWAPFRRDLRDSGAGGRLALARWRRWRHTDRVSDGYASRQGA